MELILKLAVCTIVSIIVSIVYHRRTAYGTLYIDRSNPERELYHLAIDELDKISKKKRIMLKVDNNDRLSQD